MTDVDTEAHGVGWDGVGVEGSRRGREGERERERFAQDPGVSDGQAGRRNPVLDSLPSALPSTLCGFLEP